MPLRRVALLLASLALLGGCLFGLSVWFEAATPPEPLGLPTPGTSPTAAIATVPAQRPEPTAGPVSVATPFASQPTPAAGPQPAAGQDLNILLLGTDRRPHLSATWRTDSIIVVAVRPGVQMVGLFSIPRDLWVTIPGGEPNRINTVDYMGEKLYGPGGGPRLLGATLQENLGIPVHAYVRIDFQGLERMIDALGGIRIYADRAYDEWLDDGSGGLWHLKVSPGWQHMDGRTALGYARSRQDAGDLDRCRRQQQILLAMRDAALRPAVVPQLPRLVPALADAVDTDLSPAQVLALAGLAMRLEAGAYRTRVFDSTMVTSWVTPEGAMVLLPQREAIESAWVELTRP
ncbi:MAG: LCP family protein [Anaerolineae bacterium]|nr:LCP family protein [Anaerolineae bacterium]